MPKKELRPDQIADLAMLIHYKKFANLNDPATGKTATSVAFSQYCWEYLGYKTVWTQPVGLMKKNRDEFYDFSDFSPDELVIVQGTPAERLELMHSPNGKVFFFSADGWSREYPLLLKAQPRVKVSIHDELQLYYRGHTAQRTQNWYDACRRMEAVVPMTGSLIRGKLSTAYPAIHVIDPTLYGSYEGFLAQHALVDENGKIYGWTNHAKLTKVLQAISMRRTFESIHGVEKPFIQVIKCEMGKLQRQKYMDFHEMGLIELHDNFLEAKGGGVNWIRALQIMAHPEAVKLPIKWDKDGKPLAWKVYNLLGKHEKTGKDKVLEAYIQEHLDSGEPLVIYAALIPEQIRIRDMIAKMGGKVGLINSTVVGAKRQQVDLDFKAGRIQFVVGSPATCSTGFNWQDIDGWELTRIIFVSMSPDDTDFTQAYKRGIRRLRTKKLEVIILAYENSLDQRIFQLIEIKSKEANLVDPTQAQVYIHHTLVEGADVGNPKPKQQKKEKAGPPPGGKFTMSTI